MVIRNITQADVPTIGKIYTSAFDRNESVIKYYAGFPAYVDFCIESGYALMLTADDGTDCGLIMGYEQPSIIFGRISYIELFAVMPDYQNKGYGKALIREFFKLTKERGIKEVGAHTGCYLDAYLFYRKIGFQDTRSDARFLTAVFDSDAVKSALNVEE